MTKNKNIAIIQTIKYTFGKVLRCKFKNKFCIYKGVACFFLLFFNSDKKCKEKQNLKKRHK